MLIREVGDATSITCVALDTEESNWKSSFKLRPYLADLCTIPNSTDELFYDFPSNHVGRNGPYRFT